MKTLKNEQTEIKLTETEFVSFSDLAKTCVNVMPQGGLDVMQMRDRINVIERLEKANGQIKLEDAEANTLKECVKQMKWAIIHKDVIKFVEAVEKL